MKNCLSRKANGDRKPSGRRGWLLAGIALGATIGALVGLFVTFLVGVFPHKVVLVNDVVFGPASLFDWFFLLGDTGSPAQHETNVRNLAFLFNGLLGAIVGAVTGAIASASRFRREKDAGASGRE